MATIEKLSDDILHGKFSRDQNSETVDLVPAGPNKYDVVYRKMASFIRSNYPGLEPLTSHSIDTDHLDYPGWFNYFHREVVFDSPGDDIMYGRIMCILTDDFTVKLKHIASANKLVIDKKQNSNLDDFTLNARFPLPGLSDDLLKELIYNPGESPKQILKFLLLKGFNKADTVVLSDSSGDIPLMHDLTQLAAVSIDAKDLSLQQGAVFAFRGEGRTPQVVKSQGGARCRINIESIRESANLNEEWHPWNRKDSLYMVMWQRKGHPDNDYYTVNSIATTFLQACAYPEFKSSDFDRRLTFPASAWGDDLRKLLPTRFSFKQLPVRQEGHGTIMITEEIYVFIFMIKAYRSVATTWKLADYKEAGVRDIDLGDILAYFKIRRDHTGLPLGYNVQNPNPLVQYYYDTTTCTSPAMKVEILEWGFMHSEVHFKEKTGCTEKGMEHLKGKFASLIGTRYDINHRM